MPRFRSLMSLATLCLCGLVALPAAPARAESAAEWVAKMPDDVADALGKRLAERGFGGINGQPVAAPSAPSKEDTDKLIKAWVDQNAMYIYNKVGEEMQKTQQAETEKRNQAAKQNFVELAKPGFAPPLGKVDAKYTLVVFYDLECPYCKIMVDRWEGVHKAFENVRIVFQDFPLPMHPDAEPAARLLLAAHNQGKYHEFRVKLLAAKGALKEDAIKPLADELKLDWAKLKADAESDPIKNEMKRISDLAQKSGIQGTPFMMVGSSINDVTVWPGAMEESEMKSSLEKLMAANGDKP